MSPTIKAGKLRLVRFGVPRGEGVASHSIPATRDVVDGEVWRTRPVGSKIRAAVVQPRR